MQMKQNLFDLKGRIALITGGAGLLGPEHAKALSDYGATIILADIDYEKCMLVCKKLLQEGIVCYAEFLDVTVAECWQSLSDKIIDKFGKIDILINNAGFTNQSQTENFHAPFEEFPLADWNKIMNVNLTGTFLGCRIIGNQMLQKGKGVIINMASLYGVVSPNHSIYEGTDISQPVAYSVSKHGVIGLTKYVSTLWAKRGVRINSITPGGVYNEHSGKFLSNFQQLNPISKMCDKSELRGAVVYLASDASSHVIGHNLIVDGGWTVW